MSNPINFDEASAATEEMFEAEQADIQEEAPVEEVPAEEIPAEIPAEIPVEEAPAVPQEADVLAQATQTAEIAAQTAAEKDRQLQQAMSEIEALKQQNQTMQGAIDELSRQNTENIIEEALTPPSLDINGLAFADEETQRAAMAKFAEEMSAYDRKQIMDELSPVLDFAKKGMRDAETQQVVSALSQIPELANIQELLPQLDRLIANNSWLQSDDMPLEEKYINAYAMARGINAINNPPAPPAEPKDPTPEELLAMYNNNPAFQELVEKQRIDSVKQSQQVPPFSASSGAVNAALDIKEKPKTLDEASDRTRRMFEQM